MKKLKKSVAYKKACMGQNALSQLDCKIFKSIISPEQIDEIASFFLDVDTNSQKLKFDQNLFGWVWSKMVSANLVSGL